MILVKRHAVSVEHELRHKEHNPRQVLRQLLQDVTGDDEAGHVHVAAKVAVLDGRDGAGKAVRRFHKARDRIARADAREAQQVLAAGGDSLANAGQALGIGGDHIVGLVQIGADHADAVIVLRVAVVKVRLGRLDAGIQIELIAHLEGVAAKALEGAVLEGPDHGDSLACQLGLVAVGPAKTVLMLGKTERHNAQAGDLLVILAKAQGFFQLLAVVHAGAQHNLRMNFDAGCHDGLEHVHAALSVAAHHAAADIGAHGVDRYVHRTHVAIDDVLHVLVGKVRERDKVTL